MHMPTGIVVGFMLLAFVPAEAQERSVAETRLFIAPIADRNLNVGPTLYEYLDRLMDAPECSGIVPVGREAIADFSVWFEFKDTFTSGNSLHDFVGRFGPLGGESPGGISPPGARRTVRERLRSYSSHHPAAGVTNGFAWLDGSSRARG